MSPAPPGVGTEAPGAPVAERSFAEVAGHRLEYVRVGRPSAGQPTLVLLHEGLGCADRWRRFPVDLAAATGCDVLAYSRAGYGRSSPARRPRPVRFMHDEALDVLPGVLAACDVRDPVLLGQSDGASIALIYAGTVGGVRGVVALAPHVFVEVCCLDAIARLRERYLTEPDLRARFARHHGPGADDTFHGWAEVWLDPEFRRWSIRDQLSGIGCPILVVQGTADEYGTLSQVEAIQAGAGGTVESLILEGCGHAPHEDWPERTLAAVTGFVAALPPSRPLVRRG